MFLVLVSDYDEVAPRQKSAVVVPEVDGKNAEGEGSSPGLA